MKLKKFIARILTSRNLGRAIDIIYRHQIPTRRYGKYIFDCSSDYVNDTVKASIFWGIYESAEVRFVKKFLNSELDVIELGGSIGIVSTFIRDKLSITKKLITVEANPNLITTLKANLNNNCKTKESTVLNYAVSYQTNEFVQLYISHDNAYSSTNIPNENQVKVPSITLSKILKTNLIDQYSLVSDIEGSEIEILLNDSEALFNCRELIIELHKVEYNKRIYSIVDLTNIIIQDHKFNLYDKYGSVFYFKR